MHRRQDDIDKLDSDERQNDAANAPHQEVLAQQSIGAEGACTSHLSKPPESRQE
jgi:hypothetical protein